MAGTYQKELESRKKNKQTSEEEEIKQEKSQDTGLQDTSANEW